MYAELREQGDPRMDGKGAIFDEYPHANQGHVGFYERFMRGEKLNAGWVSPGDFEKLAGEARGAANLAETRPPPFAAPPGNERRRPSLAGVLWNLS